MRADALQVQRATCFSKGNTVRCSRPGAAGWTLAVQEAEEEGVQVQSLPGLWKAVSVSSNHTVKTSQNKT